MAKTTSLTSPKKLGCGTATTYKRRIRCPMVLLMSLVGPFLSLNKSLGSSCFWKPGRKFICSNLSPWTYLLDSHLFTYVHFLRYRRIFFFCVPGSNFCQSYCGEENYDCVSITISSNFASPDTYVSLSVFLPPNTLSFKLNAHPDKYIIHSKGNFGLIFGKNTLVDGYSDSRCV